MASLPHRPVPNADEPTSTNAPATSPSPKDNDDNSQDKPPANVTPIPRIGPIAPMASTAPVSPTRPKLPPHVGSFLMGKTVDDSGDIIDVKTGQVLARTAGDLPSMVGRTVSNRQGDILGDDGELLGYVADIEIEPQGSASASPPPPGGKPKSLFEVMGRSNASLMVDEEGNILDTGGNVVGKFHDNNNPLHRKEREEREAREKAEGKKEESGEGPRPKPIPPIPNPRFADGEETRPHRRTEEERRENAEAWRKEKPGESPSDIFLDVKSTVEGIQLTIRIPTVFGGQQMKPNISFS